MKENVNETKSSRFKCFKWIEINESRKIYAIKKNDLLNRKDTESVHLQGTIDMKKAKKMF